MSETAQAMPPRELGEHLARYLPKAALPMLEALVNKATNQDAACAICYEAARQEGAREKAGSE